LRRSEIKGPWRPDQAHHGDNKISDLNYYGAALRGREAVIQTGEAFMKILIRGDRKKVRLWKKLSKWISFLEVQYWDGWEKVYFIFEKRKS